MSPTITRRLWRYHHAATPPDRGGGDAVEEGREMENALTSLEAVSPGDWNEETTHEGGPLSPPPGPRDVCLGHCRTDDNPALYHGKSTAEEVGNYLDMWREMEEEGTGTGMATTVERDDDHAEDQNADQGGGGGSTPRYAPRGRQYCGG
jgi:hypothetical protein